jgi:D-glycero-alpha-D-manno-heptose-7-phosphate kinase
VCNLAIARYSTARLRVLSSGVLIDEEGILYSAGSAAELGTGRGAELAKAALRRAELNKVALTMRNDFPRGAGLGGSSAAGVALQAALAAWCGEHVLPTALAERSRAVEVEELHVPGGSQDHYAAALGGALALHFGETVTARHIPLSHDLVRAIERRCTVVFTGQSRISGQTITAVLDAYRARQPRVVGALARMRALAEQMIVALERGSLDDLAALVGEHWEHQRALHPRITTPAIEHVLAVARAAGALGGKALGASGGGSVLVIASEERATQVRAALAGLAEPLDFMVDVEGVRVDVEQ